MNRLILTAALLVGAAAGAAAEGTVKTKTPGGEIKALVSFTPPKGWSADEYANADGADPVLEYKKLSDAVQIRVLGAPGSDYPTPKDFMAGEAAAEAGTATVAGKKLELRRRRFAIEAADPHRPPAGKSPLGTETFCVLPLKDGRYAVLAYRRSSPIPDAQETGAKAWAAFLKTVRPKAK
jgi:hypothetical protein